jgi:hypothetical protein
MASASPNSDVQIWRLLDDSPPEQASLWRTVDLEPHSPEQYLALREANVWDRSVRTLTQEDFQQFSTYSRMLHSAGADGRTDANSFQSSAFAEQSHSRFAGDLLMPTEGSLSFDADEDRYFIPMGMGDDDAQFLTRRPPSSGPDDGTVYDYMHSPVRLATERVQLVGSSTSSNPSTEMVLLNSGWRTDGKGRVNGKSRVAVDSGTGTVFLGGTVSGTSAQRRVKSNDASSASAEPSRVDPGAGEARLRPKKSGDSGRRQFSQDDGEPAPLLDAAANGEQEDLTETPTDAAAQHASHPAADRLVGGVDGDRQPPPAVMEVAALPDNKTREQQTEVRTFNYR